MSPDNLVISIGHFVAVPPEYLHEFKERIKRVLQLETNESRFCAEVLTTNKAMVVIFPMVGDSRRLSRCMMARNDLMLEYEKISLPQCLQFESYDLESLLEENKSRRDKCYVELDPFMQNGSTGYHLLGTPFQLAAKKIEMEKVLARQMGFYMTRIEAPFSFVNPMAGIKRNKIDEICQSLGVAIYCEKTVLRLLDLVSGARTSDRIGISIVGNKQMVEKAIQELHSRRQELEGNIIEKKVSFSYRKLLYCLRKDWHRIEEICEEWGVSIDLPADSIKDVESDPNWESRRVILKLYGESEFGLRRCESSLYELFFEIEELQLELGSHPDTDFLCQLASTHKCEILVTSRSGHARSASVDQKRRTLGPDLVKPLQKKNPECPYVLHILTHKDSIPQLLGQFHSSTSCIEIIEVTNEVKQFISGKKNGKLLLIIRNTGINLVLNPIDNNISLIVAEGRVASILEARLKIYDEFPSMLTFFLENRHHKKIIGKNGKNIQNLMKKYSVYTKFMNDEEAIHEFGWGCAGGDMFNSLIKTPKKNKAALYDMLDEVFKAVGEVRQEETEKTVELDVRNYLWLLSNGFGALSAVKKAISVTMRSAYSDGLFSSLIIKGRALNVFRAQKEITDWKNTMSQEPNFVLNRRLVDYLYTPEGEEQLAQMGKVFGIDFYHMSLMPGFCSMKRGVAFFPTKGLDVGTVATKLQTICTVNGIPTQGPILRCPELQHRAHNTLSRTGSERIEDEVDRTFLDLASISIFDIGLRGTAAKGVKTALHSDNNLCDRNISGHKSIDDINEPNSKGLDSFFDYRLNFLDFAF